MSNINKLVYTVYVLEVPTKAQDGTQVQTSQVDTRVPTTQFKMKFKLQDKKIKGLKNQT